jgi:hypothetical protein
MQHVPSLPGEVSRTEKKYHELSGRCPACVDETAQNQNLLFKAVGFHHHSPLSTSLTKKGEPTKARDIFLVFLNFEIAKEEEDQFYYLFQQKKQRL